MSHSVDGHNLTLDTFHRITVLGEKVSVDKKALRNVEQCYQRLLKLSQSEKSYYGVNTGFGSLKDTKVSPDQLVQLQTNLLRSHACGVGPLFETKVVRGIMLLSLNCLAKGYGGVSPAVVEQIATYLNEGIHPLIPSQGSVGSSGDLAPTAHFALTLIGEGDVEYKGTVMPTATALKKAGLKPVVLGPKSGLALINVTHAMNSVGSHALLAAHGLAKVADITMALTTEALKGTTHAFQKRVHALRPHPTQADSAANIAALLDASQLEAHGFARESIQDAYSLRCAPQVHGASRQAFAHVHEVVMREYSSVTDNPLIIGDDIISAGHFHGQPLAVAFDYLSIGISELGNISERRTERLVNPQLSRGLPAFLVSNPGLNSGFMIVQYAAAALASENKSLAHPASVDSIPTSGNQEDHVSMGTIAARKALAISQNVTTLLGIELLSACQALDLLAKSQNLKSPTVFLGPALQAAYTTVRAKVKFVANDQIMAPLIAQSSELITDGSLIAAVEKEYSLR